MKRSPTVKAEDVRLRFEGGPIILDGLDLTVGEGEHIGIVGRSGSGKSSLVNVLSGLIPDRVRGELSGKVSVCGVPLPCGPSELSGRVGVVLQDPGEMFVAQNVFDEISFSLRCRNASFQEIRTKVEEVSCSLGIEGVLDRRTRDLSGGQKQLVAIASQLVLRPDLLILDEPSSQLDGKGRWRLERGIRSLRSSEPRLSILHIEHRLEALAGCDRIAVIAKGRIAGSGPPDKVMFDRGLLARAGIFGPPSVRVAGLARDKGLMKGPPPSYRGLPRRLWEALGGKGMELPARKRHGNRPIAGLVLRGVTYRYPGTKAGVKGIDLDLTGLRSVALMGPNGSGKSTLGKLISGVLSPDRGSMIREGAAFYLFQKPSSMFFSGSVREELGGQRTVNDLLGKFGLLPLMEKDPVLLSEGERQRLGAAVALSSGAPLIVLDEPFKALDGPMVETMFNVLSSKGSPPHMIITNDPEVASRCSKVILMKDGSIKAVGAPEEVLSDRGLMASLGWPVSPASVISRRAGIGHTVNFDAMLGMLEGFP